MSSDALQQRLPSKTKQEVALATYNLGLGLLICFHKETKEYLGLLAGPHESNVIVATSRVTV